MKERRWVLFAVLALLLAGCGGSRGDEPDPATVSTWDQMVWDQGEWQ